MENLSKLLGDIKFRLDNMPIELHGCNKALPDVVDQFPDTFTEIDLYDWYGFMTQVRLNDAIYNHVENNHKG